MTEPKPRLIDLDDLTVGDLIQMEAVLAEFRPRPAPKTKRGITAETLKAMMKGE